MQFQGSNPRQQIPTQQYFHQSQQMALQNHNQAIAAVAAAAGQPQQQPAQVLYNYPPTLHGQVPAFYSQHLPGPPPMIANQAQPPQIPSMHQAQPPPGNQQGQAVQPQSSTGGGQQALAQQHIQPNPSSHPPTALSQGQQPTPGHQPQGPSRPQPTPTPPIIIQQGPAQTHQVGHAGASSSSHQGMINHPMGPPPQGLQVHDQSPQQPAPTNMPYTRNPHPKPYNEQKRQRKGIAIIDPETRKEVVVNKPATTATEVDAQREATISAEKEVVGQDTPSIREVHILISIL